MHTPFTHRTALIVWLYTNKYTNKLKQYGQVHYVSRKLKYAVLYIDHDQVDEVSKQLEKLHFVRNIEMSHSNDLPYDYDGLLDELNKKAKEVNENKESIDLFSQLEN